MPKPGYAFSNRLEQEVLENLAPKAWRGTSDLVKRIDADRAERPTDNFYGRGIHHSEVSSTIAPLTNAGLIEQKRPFVVEQGMRWRLTAAGRALQRELSAKREPAARAA